MRDQTEFYRESYYLSLHQRVWRAPVIGGAILAALKPKTVIDIGCGAGEFVDYCLKSGIVARGVERSEEVRKALIFPEEFVTYYDLRSPIRLVEEDTFDLALCFNVAEHIDPECEKTFVENVSHFANRVLFSASSDYNGESLRIINLKTKSHWRSLFEEQGMFERPEYEKQIKDLIGGWRKRPVIKMVVDNLLYMERWKGPKTNDRVKCNCTVL